VEQPAESVCSSDAGGLGPFDRGWFGPGFWTAEVEGPVGTLTVVVVDIGSEDVLERLAGKYRATAMDLAVRPPRQLGNNADSSRWMLAVLYDRRGLSRAAQIAKAEAHKSPLRSPKGPVPFSSVSHR